MKIRFRYHFLFLFFGKVKKYKINLQAPKPECEPVCEEPKCDWKCHKPNCPKPKCELVCENPNCVPKVECCPCALGAPRVSQPFPFFKEAEANKSCCQCPNNRGVYAAENPQVVADNPAMFNTMPSTQFVKNGSHFVKVEKQANIEMLGHPVPLGPEQLRSEHIPVTQEYEKARTRLNLKTIHKDRMNY